jgi:ABC-type amino acid transport system permease subunit
METNFWRKDIFAFVIIGCGLFVVLTVIAMFFYPGGTFTDFNTRGYSFFQNFFSELGMVRTHNGDPNTVSLVLFIISMFLSGGGMMAFFAAFPQFFRGTPATRILSLLGSALGIISGICFIGVAAAPADVNLPLHTNFVLWAFRLFPAAVLCYVIVLFREKVYPRGYAWELVIFLGLLIGYILLLEFGPDIKSYAGMVIQAVGQKIIVYASIISVMIQCWGASHYQPATPHS